MENTNEETKTEAVELDSAYEQLSFPSPSPEEETDRKSAKTKEINALWVAASKTDRGAESEEVALKPNQESS